MIEVGVYTIYVGNEDEEDESKWTTEVHEVASYVDNQKYPAPMVAPTKEVEWSTSAEVRRWIEGNNVPGAPRI